METNEYIVKITQRIGEGGHAMQAYGPFAKYDTAEEFGKECVEGTDDKFDVYKIVRVQGASPEFRDVRKVK